MSVVATGATGTLLRVQGTQWSQGEWDRIVSTPSVGALGGTKSAGHLSTIGILFALETRVTVADGAFLGTESKSFFSEFVVWAVRAFCRG